MVLHIFFFWTSISPARACSVLNNLLSRNALQCLKKTKILLSIMTGYFGPSTRHFDDLLFQPTIQNKTMYNYNEEKTNNNIFQIKSVHASLQTLLAICIWKIEVVSLGM